MATRRNVVITGANSGIGLETAAALASAGDRVLMCCRNPAKAEAAAEHVRTRSGSTEVEVVPLDLASFASIRACAADLAERAPVIEVLINNAGLILSKRTTTTEGFETTFGVNHLGHFLLTTLLEPQLRAATTPRVINVSSAGHWGAIGGLNFDDLQTTRFYNGWLVYCRSKLANVQFTQEMARRWTGVAVNALHPGAVHTNFGLEGDTAGVSALMMKGAELVTITQAEGALTSIHLALTDDGVNSTGGYWKKCRRARTAPWAHKPDEDRKLWEMSEQLVAAGRP